ncbi:hypothetical protein C8R42DRAFT_776500 [Lentinula raphanica]|nr:hypothetical protein C8R42DRAFT_776500 [Lentinula raphanica]
MENENVVTLNNAAQAGGFRHMLHYGEPERQGPAHDETWSIRVYINNEEYGHGLGRTQKIAKDRAAQQALRLLEERNFDIN